MHTLIKDLFESNCFISHICETIYQNNTKTCNKRGISQSRHRIEVCYYSSSPLISCASIGVISPKTCSVACGMQFCSFLPSACPPMTHLVHPSLYGTFNCLDAFLLLPLLFVWWVSCNWQRTPSHVSIHRLSFYNMFFILVPQWGYLILGYGMWLPVMRLLGGCLCLKQSGGLTSAHSVQWPSYAGLCILLLFPISFTETSLVTDITSLTASSSFSLLL